MTKFKYPPCGLNPRTEKPFARHSWEIVENSTPVVKNGIYYYRVRCKRNGCQINDPNPVRF